MNQFTLPELYCPFPSKLNQYTDVIENYSLKWVLRFNLLANESSYRRFSKSKFFLLAARVFPHSQLEELKLGNDWLSWVFIWDDQCDLSELKKEPEVLKIFHKRFLEILKGAELTSQDIPLSHALSDLRHRTLQKTNINLFHHFLNCFEQYFQGCVEEARVRAEGIVPDIETYMMIRRLTVAGYLFLTVGEFCNNFMLSDFLRNHEIVKKLKLMTVHILAWCNDIFSVSREMESEDVHNIVLVLHLQQKFTLQQAIKLAVKMHDQEIKSLVNTEASLPSFEKEINTELATYISILHTWITGNYDWYFQTARYEDVELLEAS